jgi:hypothetical protein
MPQTIKNLSPSVAQMSPNLYKTALEIGMSEVDAKLVDQQARSWKLGQQLLTKSKEKARKEFLALDPIVKNNIYTLFSDEEIFQPEKTTTQKVLNALTWPVRNTIKVAASPLVEGFKLVERYGKALNVPYTAYRQKQQGADYSKAVLNDAYNGVNSWKWDEVAKYEEKYGKALTTLARGTAERRSIGKSIDLYGGFDDQIAQAIQYAGDNPEKFQILVDEISQDAQVSPGRDLTPQVSQIMQIQDNSLGYKMWKFIGIDLKTAKGARQFKSVASGPLDGVYQIVIDPLTYTGVGTAAKAAVRGVGNYPISFGEAYKRFGGFQTKGQKLAAKYQFIAERGGVEEGMAWAFQERSVKKLWDEQLGPRIKAYDEAEGPYAKAQILESMKFDFPEWYNTDTVMTFAKNRVFDAESARKFFTYVDDTNMMVNGTVDGISFQRNAIPFARRTRLLTSAVHKTAYEIFNPTAQSKTGELLAKAEKDSLSLIETLSKVADEDNVLVNTRIVDELELEQDVNKARQILFKMGQSAKRSPGMIIWGEDSAKTADAIRSTAAAVLPNDLANAVTIWLVTQPENIQLTVVRNLQYAFMKRLGIADEDAFDILSRTYNDTSGLHAAPNTPWPEEWADLLHPAVYETQNNVPYLVSRGVVHPSQLKKGIAPLPYDELYRLSAREKVRNLGKNVPDNKATYPFRAASELFGGVTRSTAATRYSNWWAAGTLAPRLGMRTNVDEGMMYALVNEAESVFLLGASKREQDLAAMTAITGSRSGVGPVKGGFFWLAKKFNITRANGRPIDPRDAIPAAEREEIKLRIKQALEEKLDINVPLSEISNLEIREALISVAEDIYPNVVGTQSWNNLKRVMRHQPNFGGAVINSMSAKSILGGKVTPDFFESTFGLDSFSLFLKEHGAEIGTRWTPREVQKLSEMETASAMWRLFNIRFGFNEYKITEGRYFSPVSAFFRHGALKTRNNVEMAQKDILAQMEVYYDDTIGAYTSSNEELTDLALRPFSQVIGLRQKGYSDPEIAKMLVDDMLADMRYVFHGSASLTSYNKRLYDLIVAREKEVIKVEDKLGRGYSNTWSKAVASLNWNEFNDATVGFRPITDYINSDIVINGKSIDLDGLKEVQTFGEMMDKFPNAIMELMDHQVTGFFRLPALKVAVDKAFRQLKPYEEMLVTRHKNAMLESDPFMKPELAEERARLLAEKQTSEIAVQQASNSVLEYVDNPNIRSSFAISIRHLGRFVRATEDFQRRMFRMYTKQPLRALYRMRLLHMGLESAGSVYTDEKGDDYVVFPTDVIINSAINPVLAKLTGNENLKMPTATQYAIKWRLVNPSFAPDAGAPAFAGPQAAMAILTAKAFLRELPLVPFRDRLSPYTNWAADKLDMFAMGHVGKNTDLGEAVKIALPMFVSGLGGAFTPQESSRVKTSAVMQAMAYHQAFGYTLPENATTQQKKDYINALKISANNIIAGQFILGNLNPSYPTLKDSAGLPGFIKQTGVSSFKSSFWDIYDGILRNAGPDVTDPFGLALATFIGKNPNKLAYIVPRNTKAMQVFINKTDNLKSWVQNNRGFVDTYKEIGYIFAPKIGEYNPDIYSFMEAENLVDEVGLLDYLDKIQVAADKEEYFAYVKQEKEDLSKVADYGTRKAIMAQYQRNRQLLMYSNPLLEEAINNPDNRGTLKIQLNTLADAVNAPKSPIAKDTRASMQLIIQKVRGFIDFNENPYAKNAYDFQDKKAASKEELAQLLFDLSRSNFEIREANRLIFTPILNSYARSVVGASPER